MEKLRTNVQWVPGGGVTGSLHEPAVGDAGGGMVDPWVGGGGTETYKLVDSHDYTTYDVPKI